MRAFCDPSSLTALSRTQRRIFIGPHLLITPSADDQVDDVLTQRKEVKQRWHSALRRGKDVGDGNGKEREALHWAGGSFEIGKDLREACAAERTRVVEADRRATERRAKTEPARSVARMSVDEPQRHARCAYRITTSS